MKKINKTKYNAGMLTLEIIIAFAILVLNISAVLLLTAGGQNIYVDIETNTEALSKAQANLETEIAKSRIDFYSSSSSTTNENIYTKKITVKDLTPCKRELVSNVSWTASPLRTLEIALNSFVVSPDQVVALGGDCATNPPQSNWDSPSRFASDTFDPGKPTTLDVLNKIAYLGSDKTPFLHIADTTNAQLGQKDNLFVDFTNNFELTDDPNDIDVIKWTNPNNGEIKNIAFLAMNTPTNQLKILDLTDIYKPKEIAVLDLENVSGSYPQGWRLKYFKNRLYIFTRETLGRELHTIDVSDPSNPIELGSVGLNYTVEDLAIIEKKINTDFKKFLFLATDNNTGEIKVYDITDTSNTGSATLIFNLDLPGNQDGASIYHIGNKIYFGRQSNTSGPDFYAYNIVYYPNFSLEFLGSQDINTSVLDMVIIDKFAFLATSKTNEEFQVWNIENLNNITNIAKYNFGNIVSGGLDYEPDFIYSTGQSTPNFQILYDSTP